MVSLVLPPKIYIVKTRSPGCGTWARQDSPWGFGFCCPRRTNVSSKALPSSPPTMGRAFQDRQASGEACLWAASARALQKVHDVFHVYKLEGYRRDVTVQPPPPAEILQGKDEFEVVHLGSSPRKFTWARQVWAPRQWMGHPPENNSGQPQSKLTNAL